MSFFQNCWQYAQQILQKIFRRTPQLTSYTILCVDDDLDFCVYMQRLASSLGVQLDKAYSIREAKQKIENYPNYQAFIIDGHLPDGNGFELISWIRKVKQMQIPIGFLSRIYQDAASFCLLKQTLHVNVVLEKPILPQHLVSLFQELLLLIGFPSISHSKSISDELVNDLKENYTNSIFDKLQRIEKLILMVQKEPIEKNLHALQIEVHKIAGSAGSYGYPAISLLCKNLDEELTQQISLLQNDSLDSEWLSSLDDFFTRFKFYFQLDPLSSKPAEKK